VLTTKAAIRSALDELATRHGIPRKDVDYAVEGYADDMLSDAIYNVERGLERELKKRGSGLRKWELGLGPASRAQHCSLVDWLRVAG
jgi:hypothetical protein